MSKYTNDLHQNKIITFYKWESLFFPYLKIYQIWHITYKGVQITSHLCEV